jgi:hypothetical protein
MRQPDGRPSRWAVFIFLTVACTGLPPETGGPATTTSVPLTSTTTTSAPTTSSSTTITTVRLPYPGEAPDALLGTMDGVYLRDRPLAVQGTRVMAAVDDLSGGIVYQEGSRDDGVIWWLPAQESSPRRVLPSEGVFHGLLFQVAEIEDRRVVVVAHRYELGEADEYLELHPLNSGDMEQLAVVGGVEWFAERISYAHGLFAITDATHSCGTLYFLDRSGQEVEVPAEPEPPCEVHFEVPFLGATLSPDGSLVAYVAQQWMSEGHPVVTSSDLVLASVETGEELLRQEVTSEPESRIIALDFDGEWIVMARTPRFPQPATEIMGISIGGARFLASVPGVNSVWLPRVPLDG